MFFLISVISEYYHQILPKPLPQAEGVYSKQPLAAVDKKQACALETTIFIAVRLNVSSSWPSSNKFPKGKQMSLEKEARILQVASSTPCGIRDMARKLRWKTSIVVSLSRRMSEERLIEFQTVKRSSRGRPKKNIVCTSLGLDFLETYRKLKLTPLRARKEDLEHATKDALYASRLEASGHSPFKLFMELNTIARNIKKSSEAADWQDQTGAQ